MKNKPVAGISLDLDNQWSYMKTHGDKGWENLPSYYPIFVPKIIEILKELDIKITFFIVGQDAVVEENIPFLRQIVDAGHDIGNHSFNHEVWIDQYSRDQLELEISRAEKAIFQACGKKTMGFRGPGFCWSKTLLEVLYDRGYKYDASTLPTFIGPLARIYYFKRSDFSKEEKEKRTGLFGSFTEGFRRLRPYFFNVGAGKKLLEVPVTTLPFLRLPFHMSYLLHLYNISPFLMRNYLYFALFACRITRTPVSFLLHPLDIIGGDQVTELRFFPQMEMASELKIRIFKQILRILQKKLTLVDMNDYYAVLSKHNQS